LTESTGDSSGLRSLPTLARAETEPGPPIPVRRRRFSTDTLNDLIFWGCHLCVVAVSLAIVWYKIDKLSSGIASLLIAQNQETALVQKQLQAAQEQAVRAEQAERTRTIQLQAATGVLNGVLDSVGKIKEDVTATLAQTQSINQTVLDVSIQTKAASLQAAREANSAAGAANSAANAAGAAASRAASTQGLVRAKVVTTQDKIRIEQEQRALAAKRQQLTKTIRQVKKNGPNLLQKLFQ
jgi:hypothetical protein